MSKPAYLVEGHLEQKFIQDVCPNSPVRRINCNGENVSIEAIAKRIGTLGRLLQRWYRPLIVIFDREKRQESCMQIEMTFRNAIEREDINVPLIVGIPDRETENWILSDFEAFCRSAGVPVQSRQQNYEGTRGKVEIRKLLPANKAYVETIDGVAWLKNCRPLIMKEVSPSFARLMDSLSDIPCWWLSRERLVP